MNDQSPSGYASPPAAGGYDEMHTGAWGAQPLRAPWAGFYRWLNDDQAIEAMNRRQEAVNKQIADNGITYNVYSDTRDAPSRPWSLDVLPMLLSAADWRTIEAGAIERAQLLNRMMQDIYGPQTLLGQGLLPPALVYGHPGFLRPMMDFAPVNGIWLHQMAFDLARNTDGRWWVVGHRTEAPSGLGYVLENRLTIARAFPDAFRELHIQRIARFYRQYLETVRSLCGTASPRLALLTPGPFNETYFEHAYLARYLGITLVESHDLVVRRRQLFLKTVHGLEKIHGLIRRVDDDWLDPLELRPDSQLGVPGLLQAIRAGEVLVTNMPGSGWLESPALHGFLPGIAAHYLHKPLDMPSVPSWWCGEASAWNQVAQRLDTLVIKPTGSGALVRPFEPILGSQLAPVEQHFWRGKISLYPDAYTLQELIPLSQAPVWQNGTLTRRPLMVRVFAASDGQGGYTILPGGLTRIAAEGSKVVSMQRGGSSLDTWVLTDGIVDRTVLAPAHLKADDVKALRRPVSSSAAEHLYWLGRYSERAEFSLRFLARTFKLLREADRIEQPVFSYLMALSRTQELFQTPRGDKELDERMFESELLTALNDVSGQRSGAFSLAFTLHQLARVAGHIRDRLSTEHWRWVSDCQGILSQGSGPIDREEAMTRMAQIRLLLAAIGGEQSDHMTRDDGWRFLTLGRQLERLIGMCDALLCLLKDPQRATEVGLELLMGLADSVITYRARYQHRFEWLPALELVIFDEANPRSIKRILYKINQSMEKLPGQSGLLRQILRERSGLPAGLDLAGLQQPCPPDNLRLLQNWLTEVLALATGLSERISTRYFRLADHQDLLT
ncbi:MAG: circularly permuted type 2 ATP-grasp protein [Burkholderiaceae bacterium]